MGHQGQNDGSWGANNSQAEIDSAYRGVHMTAQVAKAIIARFYGQAPAYSHFSGCSDSGREALMEAQRYPEDFDGIAASAPANDLVVQNTFHHGWGVLTNRNADGNYTLLADKLPLVHAAGLAACDGLDGVADGLIDDPRRCPFNPASLLCTQGQDETTCLTEAQVGVVRRIHDGATDAEGRRLEQRIAREWGSELDWTLFVPAAQGQTVMSEDFVTSFARYLAFYNVDDPNWQLTDLQFTAPYFFRTVQTSHFWAATDPDLSRLESRGGKLILWHGWSDQHISPQGTLHSPGHTCWHVADGADQTMVLGDMTHRPELFARRAEFQVVFAFDPQAATATCRRMLDRVSADRMHVAGYHFPFPAHGFIAREGQGFRFVPADWTA